MTLTRLKAIRLSAGLTCQEMGRFIGIHPTRYSRLENNWEHRVHDATNKQLMSVLGEGFDYLMQPVEFPNLESIVQRVKKLVAA